MILKRRLQELYRANDLRRLQEQYIANDLRCLQEQYIANDLRCLQEQYIANDLRRLQERYIANDLFPMGERKPSLFRSSQLLNVFECQSADTDQFASSLMWQHLYATFQGDIIEKVAIALKSKVK